MGVHPHLVKIGPLIHFPMQYRLANRLVSLFSIHRLIGRMLGVQGDLKALRAVVIDVEDDNTAELPFHIWQTFKLYPQF
jgi:hypothetical protein